MKPLTNKEMNEYIRELETKNDILDYALEECIRQFDYQNDISWRDNFKKNLIDIAKREI